MKEYLTAGRCLICIRAFEWPRENALLRDAHCPICGVQLVRTRWDVGIPFERITRPVTARFEADVLQKRFEKSGGVTSQPRFRRGDAIITGLLDRATGLWSVSRYRRVQPGGRYIAVEVAEYLDEETYKNDLPKWRGNGQESA